MHYLSALPVHVDPQSAYGQKYIEILKCFHEQYDAEISTPPEFIDDKDMIDSNVHVPIKERLQSVFITEKNSIELVETHEYPKTVRNILRFIA